MKNELIESCRPENCGAALLLERLRAVEFTGFVQVHMSAGVVGAVKAIEHHSREKLLELAGHWPQEDVETSKERTSPAYGAASAAKIPK